MIEIKELIIRAVVDSKSEKPEIPDSDSHEEPENDCAVCESIEEIVENLNNKMNADGTYQFI